MNNWSFEGKLHLAFYRVGRSIFCGLPYLAELIACILLFRFLYDLDLPLEDKIRKIAQEMYGAGDISLSADVQKRLENYSKQVIDWMVLIY